MIINIRKQYAIGQGFFHFGQLLASESRSLSYVYDCGAVNDYAASRLREIDSATEAIRESLNFLFLSHFHDDHVNGVPILLGRSLNVDTIVMPQIGIVERLIVFAMSLSNGATNSEFYRELVVAPIGALMRFSPRQVIIVRRTDRERDGGAPGDEGPTPDGDPDDIPDGGDARWTLVGNGQISLHPPANPSLERPQTRVLR